MLGGEPLGEVDCFGYLGSQVAADGGCDGGVVHGMSEGCGAWGALKGVLSNGGLGMGAKRCLCEGVIVPAALCGAEAWGMRGAERGRVGVLEMRCLRGLVMVSRVGRVGSGGVRRRAGMEGELASGADRRVLRWFGRVEGVDDYRMARRVLMAEVSGGRVRGRPRLGWVGGVRVALGSRGVTVEAARRCAKDRGAWGALVHV